MASLRCHGQQDVIPAYLFTVPHITILSHRLVVTVFSLRADYECFQIELSKNYGQAEWRDDIKSIMLKAGLKDEQITFLFVDTQVSLLNNYQLPSRGHANVPVFSHVLELICAPLCRFQIKCESFLEDVNNILNSGDVPNLYASDEQDRIMMAMKPVVVDLGQQPTKSNLMAAYIKRVRSNIHTVLCMRCAHTDTRMHVHVHAQTDTRVCIFAHPLRRSLSSPRASTVRSGRCSAPVSGSSPPWSPAALLTGSAPGQRRRCSLWLTPSSVSCRSWRRGLLS